MTGNERLTSLDGLRGLAALVVLLFHFEVNGVITAKGYLAVDFFFLLSGFVIARTYDASLKSGLPFSRFAALRAIRIYPLFFVGLCIGFARGVSYLMLDRADAFTLGQLLHASAFEVFMLPSPVANNLFVLNIPNWSLFFEMAINLVYAALLFRVGTRLLIGVALAFLALLITAAVAHGAMDVGIEWKTFYGGVARTGFSFCIGMLISRLNRARARASWIAVIPAVVLVSCLMAPVLPGPAWVFDLAMVMLVFPVLVWVGASFHPPPVLQPASRLLGDLSYPVYAIHYPLMFIWLFFAKRAHFPPVAQLLGFILLVGVSAWLLNRYWDLPIRRSLNARLGGTRRINPTAQTVP